MLVLAIALSGAGLGFFGTERTELVHATEYLRIEQSDVRGDLDRVVQQASLGGYREVGRVPIEGADLVEFQVEVGADCAIVAAGAWDEFELSSLTVVSGLGVPYAAERRAWLDGHAPLIRYLSFCSDRPDQTVTVQTSVRVEEEFAPGGGEVVVLRGEGPVPPIVAGRLVPVERPRVVREASYGRALMNAAAVFVFLGLLGIIVQVVLFRGGVTPDGQSSLRRLSVALPSEHRSLLSPMVDAIERGDRAPLQVLRERIASHTDGIVAASWTDDRADTRRIALRSSKLLEGLRRRGRAASADYRSRGTGTIVLTVVLEHECELPDFPAVVRRDAVPELLLGLLPADLGQLTRARAMLHPVDPSQTFDDAGRARAFPELQPLDGAAHAPV